MANNVPKDATDDEAAGAIEAAVRKYIPEIVAFLLLEAIAIPFCHAGADAMLGGHVAQGIVGYLIGIPTGIAGLTFHWWKTWPIWRGIQQQVLRWWPAAISVGVRLRCGPKPLPKIDPCGRKPSNNRQNSLEYRPSGPRRCVFSEYDKTWRPRNPSLGFSGSRKKQLGRPHLSDYRLYAVGFNECSNSNLSARSRP